MQFLVDASMPRRVGSVIAAHGHHPFDVRDIGFQSATDGEIAAHAQRERLCILTRDLGFADERNYPPASYEGIVVLDLPNTASEEGITDLFSAFLTNYKDEPSLAGRLFILESEGVRVRRQ